LRHPITEQNEVVCPLNLFQCFIHDPHVQVVSEVPLMLDSSIVVGWFTAAAKRAAQSSKPLGEVLALTEPDGLSGKF
jgi:hypothetical protein